MLTEALPVSVGGVFFLQMSGIQQRQGGEVPCGRGGPDLATKPVPDQSREIPGVVKMSVGQDYPMNAARVHRKWVPVAQPQFLAPLKKSAIDHQPLAGGFQQVFRTGDCLGRSKKGEAGHQINTSSW